MDIHIVEEIFSNIDLEIKGLRALKKNMMTLEGNESLYDTVIKLCECTGKIVFLGMGKSGLVARKLASTMSSTGTPAIYVHPADGGHGDFGIIFPEDVVIAISNSGECSEIISVLPFLKSVSSCIISITSQPKSTLAINSSLVIDTGKIKEACPYNIVPTTSSTAVMVLGNAIAITLMKLKDFSLSHFLLLHPKGEIGEGSNGE